MNKKGLEMKKLIVIGLAILLLLVMVLLLGGWDTDLKNLFSGMGDLF